MSTWFMNDRFVDLGHKRSSNTKNKYVATLRSHTYFITFGADDQSKKEKKPNKKKSYSRKVCYVVTPMESSINHVDNRGGGRVIQTTTYFTTSLFSISIHEGGGESQNSRKSVHVVHG